MVDWEWTPSNCLSCQATCLTGNCKYILDGDIKIMTILKYTELPKIWSVFTDLISISPLSEQGFLTLSNSNYFIDNPVKLNVTHKEFWNCIKYFLYRRNKKIQQKRAK